MIGWISFICCCLFGFPTFMLTLPILLPAVSVGSLFFLLLYLSSIVIASISTLYKHKNNHYYNAVGASGAVSATVFASIFFDPLNPVYLFLIPIPIPGIIFGLAYLAYSHYMAKNSRDNINHEAHFYGAVYGMLFPLLIDVQFIEIFLSKLTA